MKFKLKIKQNKMEPIKGIYIGNRGDEFKMLITSILNKYKSKNGKIGAPKEYIRILTSEENLSKFSSAFTSDTVDPINNYQIMEQLGDLSANKFIVQYIYSRFPQLKCSEGVKVAARLRINYGSKQKFCEIAEKLGMWPFISASLESRQKRKKPLLEDVLEACLGTIETILDDKKVFGVGYATVYKILTGIFDEIDISLKYEELYDSKTRLKELFDLHGKDLGPLIYEDEKTEDGVISVVYRLAGVKYELLPDGNVNLNKYSGPYTKTEIGRGTASLKSDAQQKAATFALQNLAEQGWVKKPPKIYAMFNNTRHYKENVEKDDISHILDICETEEKINEQFYTRGKKSQYTSTVLGHFCHLKNYDCIKLCLKLNADPNETDSIGLFCLDLFLIGVIPEKIHKKVLKKLKGKKIHKNVFDAYKDKYDLENYNLDIIEKY